MKFYIWFELKRKINQPKTWFLIAVIFILCFQNIWHYKMKSTKYDFDDFDSSGEIFEGLGGQSLNDYKAGPEISKNSSNLLIDTGTQMRIAAEEKNYSEWKRLKSFASLIFGKAAAQTWGKLKEEAYERKAMEIWNEVSDGVNYEDIDFKHGTSFAERNWDIFHLAEAKYHYILYKQALYPIKKYHMDSMTFLYHYFNDIIPILIGFIVLVLVFDSINDEWNNGSLKVLITQPFSRKKYLISKIIAGTLNTLFIILIPAMIISIGMGIIDGFENYNYPVLYLEQGFKNFEPLPNYLKRDLEVHGDYWSFGISIYSNIPEGGFGISNRLNFIPLYKFLLLSLLLLTFCIIFYVVLNILISSATKNKIIAFSISGITTLIGTTISQRWILGDRYNLSPFTMNNPVRILNGSYNTTALIALIVLIGSTFLIFLLNFSYYQKKDL